MGDVLESLGELNTAGRPAPDQVLAAQIPSRVLDLVPLRHQRMAASPFSFFRGGAAIMAGDLARGTSTSLQVQLCGDAHLSNFGMFASPERRLVFDLNDFDETFPGPFDWDVKRLVASLAIAGRENGFSDKQVKKIVSASAEHYRQTMHAFAGMGNLSVWYARMDVEEAVASLGPTLDKKQRARLDKAVTKARGRSHLRSFAKLTEVVDGKRRLVADPPLIVPWGDIVEEGGGAPALEQIHALLRDYSGGLEPGYRELVRSYEFADMARKVVGVGSVGTRCWVVLLLGHDESDPLFLQVKEAQPSVLSAHLGAGPHRNQGSRVVAGQRIMQASSDIFLGAQRAVGYDGQVRDFYVRQLQDMKGSVEVEALIPRGMGMYGQLCAWTLARAHARSGDRTAIADLLGTDQTFAGVMTEFALAYADLNERDYRTFTKRVRKDEFLGHRVPA